MKNTTDYSDELADLKQLHEENIGRKFSDEEFNEIFKEAIKMETGLLKHAQRFVDDMMSLLMMLDDATNQWEKERLVSNVKGNPKEDIKKMMTDLKKVIEYFASNKNPNWGDVGTLAHIHEALGEKLYEKYDKHTGYSKSIEEGMKRHTEASQNLWLQAESEIQNLDPKKHLPDLIRWRNFFSDLLEGFQGILIKIDSKETPLQITPEIKKMLQKIKDYSQSHAVSSWASELINGSRQLSAEDMKKIKERYSIVERLKQEEINEEKEIGGEVWYDTATEKQIDGVIESLGWKPYKFKTDNGKYPKWEDLGKGYSEQFGQVLRQQITVWVQNKKRVEKVIVTPENSLRQEAMDIAKKLGDDELVAYLKNASLKTIQRRIQALREEVEKFSERPAKPANAKAKKK
jgi:hypothetical protein